MRTCPLAIAFMMVICGCNPESRVQTRLATWSGIMLADGAARHVVSANPGNRLDFDRDLDLDKVTIPFGVDADIWIGSNNLGIYVSSLSLSGNEIGSGKTFGDQTFIAGEWVRSDFDLTLIRLGWAAGLRSARGDYITFETNFEFIDFDLDLRSSSAQVSFDGKVPAFLVGMVGSFHLTEKTGLRLTARGLSLSGLFGFDSDFYEVQGKFQDYLVEYAWSPHPWMDLRAGLRSFDMEVSNAIGDLMDISLFGLVGGLEVRF